MKKEIEIISNHGNYPIPTKASKKDIETYALDKEGIIINSMLKILPRWLLKNAYSFDSTKPWVYIPGNKIFSFDAYYYIGNKEELFFNKHLFEYQFLSRSKKIK
jgi:hypothetical protein